MKATRAVLKTLIKTAQYDKDIHQTRIGKVDNKPADPEYRREHRCKPSKEPQPSRVDAFFIGLSINNPTEQRLWNSKNCNGLQEGDYGIDHVIDAHVVRCDIMSTKRDYQKRENLRAERANSKDARVLNESHSMRLLGTLSVLFLLFYLTQVSFTPTQILQQDT